MFPEGTGRLPDAYVMFPDGTFGISNDEGLIHHLIDRKAGAAGKAIEAGEATTTAASLADLPRFRALDRRLPDRAAARLFVDARRLSKLLATVPLPDKDEERRNLAIVQRLLGAIESAGAGLVVTDGRVVLHAAEIFDPQEFKKIFGKIRGSRTDEPSPPACPRARWPWVRSTSISRRPISF